MSHYSKIICVKMQNDINETAFGSNPDGGLVQVEFKGSNLKVESIRFDDNFHICIDKNCQFITFKNCFFSGRNLRIYNSGQKILFENCTFIIFDKMIEADGFQVFKNCDFLCTGAENVILNVREDCKEDGLCFSVISDSHIHFEGSDNAAFITDGTKPVAMINIDIDKNDGNAVIWTKEMANRFTFAWYNCSYICGSDEYAYEIKEEKLSAYTVDNLFYGSEPYLIVSPKITYIDINGKNDNFIVSYFPESANISWEIKSNDFINVTKLKSERNKILFRITGHNNEAEEIYGFVTLETEDGLKTESVVQVQPSKLEPPRFVSTPSIEFKNGRAYLNYKLDLGDIADQSEISWYKVDNIDRTSIAAMRGFARSNERDCRKIAVTRNKPCIEVPLSRFDIGKHLKVNIKPKHARSEAGPGLNIISRVIMASDVMPDNVCINVENMVLDQYYDAEPGYLTPMGHWEYGKTGSNRYSGLIAAGRCCEMYYNSNVKESNMTVYVILDMDNDGGEGFFNDGDYQEIYIKYDSKAKCGYGIRYECTDKKNHISSFTLYKYENNNAKAVSETVSGQYMKSGMDIKLTIINNEFRAEINNDGMKFPVELKAYRIEENNYSGMGIKHKVFSSKDNRLGIRHIEFKYGNE